MLNKITEEIEKSMLDELYNSTLYTNQNSTSAQANIDESFTLEQLDELLNKIKPDKYLVFVKNEELKSKLESEFDSNVKIIVMDTGDDATIINLTKAPEWVREMLEGEYW